MAKINNKIYIVGPIDEDSFLAFSETLTKLERARVRAVEIEINSPGGTVYDALAMYSRMRNSPCAFKVTAYGIVASAAVLLLAAGDVREMAEEAWVMVHEDSASMSGTTTDMERAAKGMRRLENQWNMLMSKFTKKDAAWWTKFHLYDKYMSPKQCLEIGLIDKIV